jgi:adenylyl-sulfate kinase
MKRAQIFWFTGLSGVGKTTVSQKVKDLLIEEGFSVLILDGDIIREKIHKSLSFSIIDIKNNNKLILELCLNEREVYDFILVTIISPFDSSRKLARNKSMPGFYEVYCKAEIEELIKRDTKGLYSKAINGEIDNLIGFSPKAVYEPPENPDIILNSSTDSIDTSVNKLFSFALKTLKTI